jgi:crotonobetainyl-CoA:carnitine CoA-transferase CaiB-like acyl-CoA transferase
MKLEGLRVLDLSLFLPGPWLTQMMADHGAEVIKIEPPAGEPVRNVGYVQGDATTWFRNTHRGKKSLVLNFKNDADHAVFMSLCATADVVVEAFRPGVAERLGIGPDAVRARNPRIVYARISAFGQTGPESRRPAHDLGIEAMAGVVSLNLGQDGAPAMPHVPVADALGSMTALAGVLMALLRRETTGRGDTIDISMQDATMAWLPNVVGPVFAENRPPRIKEERSFGGYAFYNLYRTACGGHIALAGVEHKFVTNLLTALNRTDLIPAATGPNGPGQTPVREALAAIFVTRTRTEWEAWFTDKDVCFAPVLDLHEAWTQPQVAARGMLLRDAAGNHHIGNPLHFVEEPARPDLHLPALDEHGPAIRASLSSTADPK